MKKVSLFYKSLCLILLVSIFFTSCDIPDISEFTTQSAEMTRGIRQGVSDTGEVLKNASERDDLFEDKNLKRFKELSDKYQKVMKPTLATMDSLDNYLESLNALSKANKKAGDNSKAVVGAVGNLVAAVSGLALADTAISIATGALTALEKFRLAKSFKERVNSAAEIVEGRYKSITDEKGKEIAREKKCTSDKKDRIEDETKILTGIIAGIIDGKINSVSTVDDTGKIVVVLFNEETPSLLKNLSDNYKKKFVESLPTNRQAVYNRLTTTKEREAFLARELKAIKNKSDINEIVNTWKNDVKRLPAANQTEVVNAWKDLLKKRPVNIKQQTLKAAKILTEADEKTIEDARKASDEKVYEFGCGVIDLLKFTLEDLKEINNSVLPLMVRNSAEKNDVILGFHEGIMKNDKRTQNQLRFILDYKELIALLKQEYPNPRKTPIEKMETVRNTLDSLFMLDGRLKITAAKSLADCNTQNDTDCGRMPEFLTVVVEKDPFDPRDPYTDEFKNLTGSLTVTQWESGISVIERDLDARAELLYEENKKYIAELDRIEPLYKVAVGEIEEFENKQIQMNKLLTASINALDKWAATHANLRVTLNTKKPLTAAALAGSVKEIWSIINSEETE